LLPEYDRMIETSRSVLSVLARNNICSLRMIVWSKYLEAF